MTEEQEAIAKARAELEVVRELLESAQRNELRMIGTAEALTDAVSELKRTIDGLCAHVEEIHKTKPSTFDKLLSWSQTWPGRIFIVAIAIIALTAFGVDLQAVGVLIRAMVAGG